jgi:hypothetical protein
LFSAGRELQGGIQLAVNGTGFENRTFTVRLGETLETNGSVRWEMTAGCHYEERWTLANGMNVFDMGQEYKEWRWAELLELPFPIELRDVGAWVVHYPLDEPELEPELELDGTVVANRELTQPALDLAASGGVAAEAAPVPSPPLLPYAEKDTITSFDSSDSKLNAVWELGKGTPVLLHFYQNSSFYQDRLGKNDVQS